ncbi:MAG: Cytochrome c-type biogenesis protein CcdA (DsbD analog), partial [uncultured Solirubrobacterales bacterium]
GCELGRRHHRRRRLCRRPHLLCLAVRASARARLPVGDLRRLLCRHRGRPPASPGPRARAAVLPLLLGHVHRPRHDRHRSRADPARESRRPAPDRRRDHRGDGFALRRHAVRAVPAARLAARGAAAPRLDRGPDRRRARLCHRLAAVHRPDPRGHPHRGEHPHDRRPGRPPARLLRRRPRRAVRAQRARLFAGDALLRVLSRPLRRDHRGLRCDSRDHGRAALRGRAHPPQRSGPGPDGAPGDQLLRRAL